MIPVGLCAQLACIWETTARNPGNAHRYCDFDDVSYLDFLTTAAAIAPILDSAPSRPVGQTVLLAIEATHALVPRNTNLGIVLLLAPLATVSRDLPLRQGVVRVLDALTVEDADAAYRAIRLAAPAGLGEFPEQDIARTPTVNLREAMALAAERDTIALQYANGFHEVIDVALPLLQDGLGKAPSLEDALIYCHIALLARIPDSLIARKCCTEEATQASVRAKALLAEMHTDLTFSKQSLFDFDIWLRSAGRGRNPGTTSDLVTACLFVALRENIIQLPLTLPWSRHD